MDMKNILKNFNDASTGKKPSAAGAAKNEMKSILESFNRVQECGMDMPQQMPQPDPVTMNVTLNARGKDAIEDLIGLMGRSKESDGMDDMQLKMAGPRDGHDDMKKLIAMTSAMEEEACPKCGESPCCCDEEVTAEEDEWSNSPDERYDSHDTMIHDLSGGINKEKKMSKPGNRGDNPLALEDRIKADLKAALAEKYASDAQRKAVHAAKDEDEKDQKTNEDDDPCWDGYEMIGMKEKNGKEVPNCVPKK